MGPRVAAAALLAVLVGCADDRATPTVRPGDSLFDLTDAARVDAYPASNLDPAVRRAIDAALDASDTGDVSEVSVPMVTREVDDWTYRRPYEEELLPEHLRGFIPPDAALRLYTKRPDVVPSGEPVVLRDGAPEAWDFFGEPFPGELVYWDAREATLAAIAPAEPRGIRLAYDSLVGDEFGAWERRLALGGETPTARELERRVELDAVSRPVLLAPPPSRLSFELPALDVDGLAVSVGVVDHGWRGARLASGDTAIERATGLGDGVAFAVEVTRASGDTARVWSASVTGEALGAGFVDDVVDLSAYRGEAVTLHLVTAVPTGAVAAHGYGVWSGLRFVGEAARAPTRPHVVIVDIDTLRPDRLGVYGHDRPTSPRVDAWAAERAVVFERARTTGPYTLPTTASIMTGLDVHQHGVDRIGRALSIASGPIAAVLRAAGYETRAVAEGAYLAPSFGFDLGFDHYTTAEHKAPDWSDTVEWAAARRSERPLFLFLHTYLVHAPFEHDPRFVDPDYDGPYAGETITNEVIEAFRLGDLELSAADRRYVSDLYDGLVRRMDDLVADTLAGLRDALGDDVLVIFLSDHGEEFFERDLLAHGHSLYNELLHVPLIVRFPDGRTGRDDRPASVIDVVPTILDIAGIDAPPHLPGHSLAAPPPADRALVSRFSGRAHAFETASGWKLIRGRVHTPRGTTFPDPQLFDLGVDPAERKDLAGRRSERLADLDERLDSYLDEWSWRVPVVTGGTDAATLRTLAELGYADRIRDEAEDR